MNIFMQPALRRQALRLLRGVLLAALGLAWLPSAPAAAQEIEPASPQRAAINPLLAQDLAAANGPVSFLVVLREQLDGAAVLAAGNLQSAGADARRAALYAALTAHAERTQAPLRAWLDAAGISYTPHYLINMLEVQGDAALAEQLRLRPEVDRLARNPAIQQKHSASSQPPGPSRWQSRWQRLPLPAAQATVRAAAQATVRATAQATPELPYGLSYTHADQVWELGVHGEEIVVGSQDTGVQWDHPALLAAYRGWDSAALTVTHAYNWFDPFGRDLLQDAGCATDPQIPCDDQGHGTHTVGTMVGDATADGGTVLGMAPAAKWIGCRNMRGGVGSPASYTACFEWFLAPYPQGGDPFRDGQPELAPDIINNSWGCPPYEGCDADSLLQVTNLVRTAGIFIAASAGNDGWLGCSTITDPIAIYDSAFTTGAHDEQGNIASFSSRGPVTVDGSGRLKPDISAPGVGTYSTYPPSSYTSLSGTSMASPHVAGAVALLWSAVPALAGDIERTEAILRNTAAPVTASGCGPGFAAASPNNVYGYGRLDILAAVNSVLVPATLTITVVTSSSLPVSGETVQLVNNRTRVVYSGVSDPQGRVTWDTAEQPLIAGSYTVRTQGCTGYRDVERIELAPDDAANETIVLDAFICQYLPWIVRQQ